jgi:hypothetical protein
MHTKTTDAAIREDIQPQVRNRSTVGQLAGEIVPAMCPEFGLRKHFHPASLLKVRDRAPWHQAAVD